MDIIIFIQTESFGFQIFKNIEVLPHYKYFNITTANGIIF